MRNASSDRTKADGKSRGKLASIGLAATVLVALLSVSSPTLAAVCKDVKFTFKNNSDVEVRVTKVRYRDRDDNTSGFRTESIKTTFCPPNGECNSNGDNLGSISRPRRNHELFDFQAEHQSAEDDGWSDKAWSRVQQPDDGETCNNDRYYGRFDLN